ncbi:MAG: hypothetical protein EP346_13730 [Bacteroidetes bacterium]|nr:MAG: hypothetical protein EP346_13730 [Bacteroidota bacterium]
MNKYISTLTFMLASVVGWGQYGEIRTENIYYDHNGVSYLIHLEHRTAGTNANPAVQFRLVPDDIKVRSLKYNGKYYSEEDLMRILYFHGGEYEDYPRDLKGNLFFHLTDIDAYPVGCTWLGSNYRSDEIVATQEGWNTLYINSSTFSECLSEKDPGDWVEYGGIDIDIQVTRIQTSLNLPIMYTMIREYEADQGGNDIAKNVLEQYCNRNYSSETELRRAISEVNRALNEQISVTWMKEALETCRTNLQQQLEEMGRPEEDYSANGQYNKYVQLGRQAEANGNYHQAINYYKEALKYKDDYYLRQRIKELEPQADTQAIAAGAVTFAVGMEEAFGDLPTGRIRYGTYVSSISYMGMDMYRTDGLPGVEMTGMSGYVAYDHNFWLDKNAYTGIHLGVDGFLSTPWDNYIDNAGTDNEWTFSLDNYWTLGGYVGFNLYGYLEIDYYIRGLAIEGERYGEDANLNESYSVGFGGPVHYDGGLRSALYLVRNKELFIRAVGWWVDNTDKSPIGFLDFTNNTDIRTQSMGYRLEIVKRPWCFAFYHQVDSYYPYNNSLNIGIDTWGIGLAFGGGTDY